ncbi:enoyl-CoA hydratase/isomerase family protein [Oceanibaculum pacificum]|uniref:3-hydroxyisobutyryl-CoA hydrolase n=1 Tax=Oceanibaculum pacificum TaxID=580166 RepID=A0A154W3Z7_9PROT|nr:enoyl-CoA hydratase/isomerase family protein [Oceanibaculum pacificum]KZD08199.1 enoyl-CoA hydratase [Oceanibaculum pacificum]
MDQEIRFEVRGKVGVIALDRPKALNALSMGMIEALDPQLAAWEEDDAIEAVLIKGEGGKAFCAGGDVRAIWQSIVQGNEGKPSDLSRDFFAAEYRLNRRIHHFPKPYVALLDGITMGGGVGLSRHGRFRIATEKTMIAMPETGIGLFPDVGGSWFLNECPGWTGYYLALTGARLNAADAIYVEMASHFVPSEKMGALEEALYTADWAASDPETVVRHIVQSFADAAGQPPMAANRAKIDACFRQDSVPAILAALETEGGAFGRETLETLRHRSPTSVCVSFEQLRRGRGLSIEEALAMEYRLTQACMQGHDFFEGIRAVLVDKDHAPKWNPATIEEVDAALVERHFAELGARELTF